MPTNSVASPLSTSEKLIRVCSRLDQAEPDASALALFPRVFRHNTATDHINQLGPPQWLIEHHNLSIARFTPAENIPILARPSSDHSNQRLLGIEDQLYHSQKST